MRAVLLRHGEAAPPGPEGDHARPLTARGAAQARAMGRWIAAIAGPIDRALVSDAVRTRETWAHLGLAAEAETRADLYLAEETAYFRALPPGGTALVVGHNDGIGVAAAKLVERDPDHAMFLRYPPCAAVVLEWDGPPAWRTGRVLGFAVPDDLG